jgi:hypothetical protein
VRHRGDDDNGCMADCPACGVEESRCPSCGEVAWDGADCMACGAFRCGACGELHQEDES